MSFGESWWSRRFIAAVHEVADAGRLSRGRGYARGGRVMQLLVEPRWVTARVRGSERTPYSVVIELVPFTDEEWARAEEALAGQALFLAALLAGEMPRDVEEAFTSVGLSLFPAAGGELFAACTCPDPVNPCKHVAATFYILAEAFDADPFLVLAWRGRTRESLLERLRELRAASPAPAAAPPPEEPAPPAPADFWRAGPELHTLHITPRAAEIPDAVLRQLGPLPPEAGGERAFRTLSGAYSVFTAAAERRAFADGDEDP